LSEILSLHSAWKQASKSQNRVRITDALVSLRPVHSTAISSTCART